MNALVVEDNPIELRVLQNQLDIIGISAETCTSLNSAVKRLQSPGVDIVLLDLNLDDSMGLDTIDKIMPVVMRTPVLVITGTMDVRAVYAMAKGINGIKGQGQRFQRWDRRYP